MFEGEAYHPSRCDPSMYAAVTGDVIQVGDYGLIKRLRAIRVKSGAYSVYCVRKRIHIGRVVGRVVWESFRDPVPTHSKISYIDGNEENAALENLQLCRRKRAAVSGSRSANAKLSSRQVMEIREQARTKSYPDLSREYGVSYSTAKTVVEHRAYRDVPAAPSPLPATREVKDAVQHILCDIGMAAEFAVEFSREMDCDGYTHVSLSEASRRLGMPSHASVYWLKQAISRGVIERIKRQQFRVPGVSGDPESAERLLRCWEDEKKSERSNDQQLIDFEDDSYYSSPRHYCLFASETGRVIFRSDTGEIKRLKPFWSARAANTQIQFSVGGKWRAIVYGKVVYETFRGEVSHSHSVIHIDGDKFNASINNLRHIKSKRELKGYRSRDRQSITDYQREKLLAKLRKHLKRFKSDAICHAILTDVDSDGTHTLSNARKVADYQTALKVYDRLVFKRVVKQLCHRKYQFLNMPLPRPADDDPKKIAEHHDVTRQACECTVENFTRAIELLGRVSLQAVFNGSGVPAGIAEQLARILHSPSVLATLLEKYEASELAMVLKIPLNAAIALEKTGRGD